MRVCARPRVPVCAYGLLVSTIAVRVRLCALELTIRQFSLSYFVTRSSNSATSYSDLACGESVATPLAAKGKRAWEASGWRPTECAPVRARSRTCCSALCSGLRRSPCCSLSLRRRARAPVCGTGAQGSKDWGASARVRDVLAGTTHGWPRLRGQRADKRTREA